jgi:ATP-binding cassette subfamily F protein 3
VRALADFGGAVLLITHDPHLVELVADRLLLVEGGTVTPYDGDIDEYRGVVAERGRGAPKPEVQKRRDERRDRADARAAVAPLRKKAKDAEARLARLARERAALERALADPDLYDPARKSQVLAAQAKLASLKKLIGAAETDWLEAEEALEMAQA